MKTRVNLLLIRMKKQVSEFTWVIPLLKKIFGKHFKVFYKFEDLFDEFIKFSSLQLYVCVCVCVCAYFYVYVYVYMCILYVYFTFAFYEFAESI